MKKFIFKIGIAITLTLFIIISSTTLSTVTLAQNNEGYLIVFDDDQIPMDVIKLLDEKYSTLPKTIISEIGILKLEKTNKREQEQAIEEITKKFTNVIHTAGKESQLIVPDKLHLTKNPHDFTSNHQYLMDKDTIFPKNLTSLNSIQEDKSEELFKILGWDIPKVTDNGESYIKQRGNHSIKIAIIDSGIDFNHPDLKGNIISKGKSFVPGVDNTVDNMGHGTMTAGAIAANGRMLGVGPDLGVIPYKVMDTWDNGGESTWVIEAIIQAAKDNVDVINLSLGTYKSLKNKDDRAIVEGYSRAIKFAHKKGSIVVASAGNEGYDTSKPGRLAEQMGIIDDKQIHLPGNSSNFLLNISATNKSNEISSYSNFGEITLAAPGGDYGVDFESSGLLDPLELVLTAYPTNLPQPYISQILGLPEGYTLSVGTSLAAPKVSGAIGVLIAEKKEKGGKSLSIRDVEKILQKSSIDLGKKGKDPKFGYGLLNVNKALDFVK